MYAFVWNHMGRRRYVYNKPSIIRTPLRRTWIKPNTLLKITYFFFIYIFIKLSIAYNCCFFHSSFCNDYYWVQHLSFRNFGHYFTMILFLRICGEFHIIKCTFICCITIIGSFICSQQSVVYWHVYISYYSEQ